MTARSRASLLAPVLASLALGSALFGCQGAAPPPAQGAAEPSHPAGPRILTLSADAIAHAGIAIETVQQQTRAEQIRAPGLIALDETRTARIGSLQEGLVLETHAQVGDRVKARQLVATMHGHAVHDAWAGYRKAMADRRRLEKELAFAVEAHERAKRLYADKAISLQELQRAEVDRVSATELVDMAKSEIRRSIEELEHVGIEISGVNADTTTAEQSEDQIPVRTPLAGVVLQRLVTPGTTVTPGAPLFVVSDLSTLWVVAEIDESHLARVRTGRPVQVTVAAYPNETFAGRITFVGDVVNPATRRITVRSVLANPQGRLKPEMFATVSLGEGEPRPVIVLPQDAVQTVDGRPSVFVASGEGRFSLRPVELGAEEGGVVEVTAGVTAGERVAVKGSFALKSEWLKAAGSLD